MVVEAPELAEMVEQLEYDTVYHEHLCYLSVLALQRLCEEAGLRIEFLHEFPFSHYGCLPILEEEAEDRWVVRGAAVETPLMFSVRAAAPARA